MKFSIIVVCLNAGEKLYSTLDSILKQTNKDYEVVIKDGLSTDDSVSKLQSKLLDGALGELVPSSKDSSQDELKERIHIYSEKDKSIYDAMNQAVKYAKGDYYIFLNCGDLFASERVLEDRAKEKNDRQKEKQQLLNEIDELKRKSDALYDDKFNGIISVDTYTRMSSQTEKQISALNYRIYEIDNEENQIKEDTKEIAKHEEQIKSLLNLDEPNRELIKTLVKNIYIDKDRNIEIQYRFKVLDDIKTNYEEIN